MRHLFGVFLLVSFLSFPAAAATPDYLLAPEEIARYRALEGKPGNDALDGTPGGPLDRVIRHVVDRRGGKYSGNNWSMIETFYEFVGGPPDPIVIDRDRYLLGSGCRLHSCPERAAFLIDLQTGEVAIAIVHYMNAAGNDIGANLTLFTKTCVSAEFRAFALARFRRWAPEGDNERNAILTTRCDSTPRPVVSDASRPRPPAPPLHRLTAAEIADLRSRAGRPGTELQGKGPGYLGLKRTAAAIVDKAGFYDGKGLIDDKDRPSALGSFYGTIFMNPEPSRILGDRFLVAGGCDERSCWDAGSLAIDLVTGDVAVGIVHRVDVRGITFYDRGRLTIFRARCADGAFVAFVTAHFTKWSETAVWQPDDPSLPPRPAPSTVLTPCRS